MNKTDPHGNRSDAILKEYPEIKKLYGPFPPTAYIGILVVLTQYAIAYTCALSSEFILVSILSGITIGPYFSMFLLAFMHEASHGLILHTRNGNRFLGCFANLPLLLPIFEIFRQHHLAHHVHRGDETEDVDCPLSFEVRWVGRSSVLKTAWIFFNPIILPIRSIWKRPVKWNVFVICNWICCFGAGAFVYATAPGPGALLYLFISAWMSQSLHPANARLISEHMRPSSSYSFPCYDVNTHSYYGPMNAFNLNIGFHKEHHDFPRVPFLRLPQLREIAGSEKWYPSDSAHQNRGISTLISFIFDKNLGLEEFSEHKTTK